MCWQTSKRSNEDWTAYNNLYCVTSFCSTLLHGGVLCYLILGLVFVACNYQKIILSMFYFAKCPLHEGKVNCYVLFYSLIWNFPITKKTNNIHLNFKTKKKNELYLWKNNYANSCIITKNFITTYTRTKVFFIDLKQ